MPNADFEVMGGGTVYLVAPLNQDAKNFLESVAPDEAQFLGNNLAVEHRYISGFVEQLRNDGWSVR